MDSSYIDDKGFARYCSSGELIHLLVAQRKLGRKLKPWEIVHHRNRNKLDNRPINIYVCRNVGGQLIIRSDVDTPGSGYVLGV
ncbi:MAG: HNH endonuclease [Chryseolinea sp.]